MNYQNNCNPAAAQSRCANCGAPLYGKFCNKCGARQVVIAPGYAQLLQPKKNGAKTAVIIISIVLSVLVLMGGCTVFVVAQQSAALRARERDEASGYDEYGDYYDDENGDYYGNYYEDYYDYITGYTNKSSYLVVEPLGSTRVAGTEEFPIPAGKIFFIIKLRLTNISGEIHPYDAKAFELCNTEGNLSPAVQLGLDKNTALGSGRLLPNGGSAEGTVAFMLEEDEARPELYIDDAGEIIHFPIV